MDTCQFVASVVDSLAWPATIVVLVLVLRGPLEKLVPMLQKMKFKDFELSFGEKIDRAREDAGLALRYSEGPAPPEEQKALELAVVSPRAAVTEAWLWVETAATEAADRLQLAPSSRSRTGWRRLSELVRHPGFDRGAASMLQELRSLRNEAAHSPQFALSADSAVQYIAAARQLVAHLHALRPGDTP